MIQYKYAPETRSGLPNETQKGGAVMRKELRQNLEAAGCSKRFIAEYAACLDDSEQCARMLAAHRRSLLDHIHREEQQIRCLDYLVYTMKGTEK